MDFAMSSYQSKIVQNLADDETIFKQQRVQGSGWIRKGAVFIKENQGCGAWDA